MNGGFEAGKHSLTYEASLPAASENPEKFSDSVVCDRRRWLDEYGVATLEDGLRPYGVSVLKGGLSDTQRSSAIQNFRTDPRISVLLATLKTGGVPHQAPTIAPVSSWAEGLATRPFSIYEGNTAAIAASLRSP